MRLTLALATLLSSIDTSNSFHTVQSQASRALHTGIGDELRRAVASASSSPEYSSENDSLGDAVSSMTNAARDSIAKAVSDEPDQVEVEIALKRRRVNERIKTFKVTLPLTKQVAEAESILSMGLTLCEIGKGRIVGDDELDLDSLRVQPMPRNSVVNDGDNVDREDGALLAKRVDRNFQGLAVSSVAKGSAAWAAGVRAGDILRGTSATLGDKIWPKSTLDGVRSAVTSRRAVAGSIQLEFQRGSEAVDNQFELTLPRPIGLELAETEDGYVEVTGFTANAPTLIQYAVKVGDRVVAIDSSLGDKMWPVSTVEGVISSVTSRLPGRQVTLRFERPLSNMDTSDAQIVMPPATATQSEKTVATVISQPSEQKKLLKRCRDTIRRYMTEEQQQARSKFSEKYSLPALVADKVLDALASAGATVDCVTLSMIMRAYLSCQKPNGAIRAFEAIVGLNAEGSSAPIKTVITGQGGKQIATSPDALNVFTASSLLKAHAIKGDVSSIKRVLAALEGKSGLEVDGIESMSWPQTGRGGVLRPDTQCYNIAISAAAESKAKDGLSVALELFDRMQPPGEASGAIVTKNLVTYNTVLGALTKSGAYSDAIGVFYDMKRAGVKPDKYSYTSLIKAVLSAGDIDELLYDMREQGVEIDIVTYNTIIKSLCEDRKLVQAKKMVNQMESSGVSPDSITYGYLMSGLMRSGNPSACITLFESACADRRTVALTENVHVYTTAITASAALGDHERAFDLVARMNLLGIQPNLKTLTALMGACLASEKPALAADIYRRIDRPDAFAMEQGLRALCAAGFLDEALTAVAKQVRGSRLLSGKQMMTTYKTLLTCALERHEFDLSRQVVSDLLEKGNIPSKQIFQAMFDAMRLFPAKKNSFEVVAVDENSSEKFAFLLFVLDSVQRRHLPCEGTLYSAIVKYGARLGGLPRKIVSLMASARVAHRETRLISDVDRTRTEQVVNQWEDALRQYDELKDQFSSAASLPALDVRIPSKDMPRVLSAEQNLKVAFTNRSRRR